MVMMVKVRVASFRTFRRRPASQANAHRGDAEPTLHLDFHDCCSLVLAVLVPSVLDSFRHYGKSSQDLPSPSCDPRTSTLSLKWCCVRAFPWVFPSMSHQPSTSEDFVLQPLVFPGTRAVAPDSNQRMFAYQRRASSSSVRNPFKDSRQRRSVLQSYASDWCAV